MRLKLSISLVTIFITALAASRGLADDLGSEIVIKSSEQQATAGKLAWPSDANEARASSKPSSTKLQSAATASLSSVKQPAIPRSPVRDPAADFFHQGLFVHRNGLGEPAAEGEYREGKRIGRWLRYYRAGEGDMFSGPFYDDFQRPFIAEVDFVDGEMTGLWTVTDSKGRKIGQWELDSAQRPHGKSTWYYANGNKMREVSYFEGVVEGKLAQWEKDGRAGINHTYQAGRQLKEHTEFYTPPHKKAQGAHLLAGQVNRCTCDWWSGTVKTTPVADYPQDDMHGVWMWWYEDGRQQMRGKYESGVASGVFTWWYPNGQRHMEGSYADGKQHGRWDWWYPGGMKQRRGEYAYGDPTGRWTSYTEEGALREEEQNFTADTPNQTLSAEDPLAPKKEVPIAALPQVQAPPAASVKKTPRKTALRTKGPSPQLRNSGQATRPSADRRVR